MASEYFDAHAHTRLESGVVRSLARALDSIDRARAAGDTCNRLTNLSDDELAGRGMKREDIPRIVINQLLGRAPAQRSH